MGLQDVQMKQVDQLSPFLGSLLGSCLGPKCWEVSSSCPLAMASLRELGGHVSPRDVSPPLTHLTLVPLILKLPAITL